MKRLVIAIDCDDVLVNTTHFFVDAYNKEYGTSVQLAQAHDESFDIWQADKELLASRLSQLMDTEAYRMLGPRLDEVVVLKELAESHELHVVTARREGEREATQAMLDRYVPGIFTSLEFVGFEGSKGGVCKKISADILIDDNARHLHDALGHGLPEGGAILFGAYEWNAPNPDYHDGLISCHDWDSVKSVIEQITVKNEE